jgi:hypothetical protein
VIGIDGGRAVEQQQTAQARSPLMFSQTGSENDKLPLRGSMEWRPVQETRQQKPFMKKLDFSKLNDDNKKSFASSNKMV